LEISSLDPNGKVLWKFPGSDIFTTLTGKGDFQMNGELLEATNWEGVKFTLDANTGRVVHTTFPDL
jgi:hypothetical protein